MMTDDDNGSGREGAGDDASAQSPQQLLVEYLQTCSDRCPGCGYILRGLTEAKCPECGEPLVLSVEKSDETVRSYLAGLGALSAATGFNGLVLAFFLIVRLFDGLPLNRPYLPVTSVGFVITGTALVAWIRNRRRFQRRSGKQRVTLCYITWVLLLASFAAVVATFLWWG